MEAVVALNLIYWGTRWAVTEGFKANRKAVTAALMVNGETPREVK